MKKSLPIAFLAVFAFANLAAQNQKWLFGGNAGLDFSTSPPTPFNGNVMTTYEGVASISDTQGNLLFYTDGMNVYAKNHQLMANGSGLNGHFSTTQSALIVQQPGVANLYYVFTLDKEGGPAGLSYSIVDLSLAAGMGSVTAKNTLVYAPSAEKLCATRHCNGTDVWIVSHEAGSSSFRSYLLSSTGLSGSPAITSLGNIVGISNPSQTYGQIKISPNGKRLAAVHFGDSRVDLFNFDATNGTLSNLVTLSTSMSSPYGCEFSQDGTKLYATEFLGGKIYQWDVCAGASNAIINSKQMFSASSAMVIYGAMQLGPDGKIYVARSGFSDLGVINNPNLAGSACNFVDVGLSIAPNTCSLGLPAFLSTFAKKVPGPFTFTTLKCQITSFTTAATPPVNLTCSAASHTYSGSYWIFGDPLSGTSNTSTSSSPTHTYTSAGTYYPKQVFLFGCGADTVTQVLTFTQPAVSISGKTVICKGEKTVLTAQGASSYTWQGGATTSTVALSPTLTTTYNLTGSGGGLCPASKLFTITVNPCAGLDPISEDRSFFIYPNPAKSNLYIETANAARIRIMNKSGELLVDRWFESGNHSLDLSSFSAGIYVVQSITGKSVRTMRLVKIE